MDDIEAVTENWFLIDYYKRGSFVSMFSIISWFNG
jgi:hypothetical protein